MSNDGQRSFPQIETFFIGGVGDEVTGSSVILKIITSDGAIRYGMIDAGAVQGEEEYRNYSYPVLGQDIDFVILTHAHYDHVGALAMLYKTGFKGKIYVSEISRMLITPMLHDGAKVCSQKIIGATGRTNKLFRRMKRKLQKERINATTFRDKREFEAAISQFNDNEFEPLYTVEDVEEALKLVEPTDVLKYIEVLDGVKIRLMPTTHQNGACRVELYTTDPITGDTFNMVFSGDIGPNEESSLLYQQKFDYTNKDIDCMVLEVLHGVKPPEETLKTSIKRLNEIIRKGIRQRKHIVLAGFSLDRNAMLVYLMNQFRKQGINVRVMIDSPLTMCQLAAYQKTYETNRFWFKDLGKSPFDTTQFDVVKHYRTHVESVMHGEAPRVIITASATGSGGRIVDYFEQGIERGDYVFVFCGWSSPDSPSSVLHDAKHDQIIEMPERRYKKKCKTYRIHGLSSHGYYPEMVETLRDYPNCQTIVLNHARLEDKIAVSDKFEEFYEGNMVMPNLYDAYVFSKDGVQLVDTDQAMSDFDPVVDRNVVLMEFENFFGEEDEDFGEGDVYP